VLANWETEDSCGGREVKSVAIKISLSVRGKGEPGNRHCDVVRDNCLLLELEVLEFSGLKNLLDSCQLY
jgi:hypothetical protein